MFMPMLISAQSDSEWEFTRSADFEGIRTHPASGTAPTPIKLNTNPIMIARLTGFQSNSLNPPMLQEQCPPVIRERL
jgi:hypothetical protein